MQGTVHSSDESVWFAGAKRVSLHEIDVYMTTDPPREKSVKPETTRGARRLLPQRNPSRRPDSAGRPRLARSTDDGLAPVELAEFLEPDDGLLPIDPVFREQLRERLWEILCDRALPESAKRPSRSGS
jgi:hypothetical protein